MTDTRRERAERLMGDALSEFQDKCFAYGQALARGRGMHKVQREWAEARETLIDAIARALPENNAELVGRLREEAKAWSLTKLTVGEDQAALLTEAAEALEGQ